MAGDEISTLLGSLERQRRTLAWKCGGLDSAGMNARVGVSKITLGGLLKHMALVENHHFAYKLHGISLGAPWDQGNWDENPDWDWDSAANDSPEYLMGLWTRAVADSRVHISAALADGQGLDRDANFSWPDGSTPTLRRMLIDLVEEYARHVGHADLIRESVDGLVGEDPPN